MNKIAIGKQAIDFLTEDESLVSGKLLKFSVYVQENRLFLDLDINLLYSNTFSYITIRLIDVVKYSFNYAIKSSFYYIEDYKLFITSNQFYICLDPFDDSSLEINENDNDFAIATSLEVYTKT